MQAGIEIWTGLDQREKLVRLMELHQQPASSSDCPSALAQTLWLVPHGRDVRERLAGLGRNGRPVLAPQLLTWRSLAQLVLTRAGEPVTEVSPGQQRVLMRTLLRQLRNRGDLRHFGPLAGSTGLLDQLLSWIDELKRAGIEPEELQRTRGRTDRERDLARIYALYQQTLERHRWYDAEGLTWRACDLLNSPSGPALLTVRQVLIDGFDDFDDTQFELVTALAKQAERTVVTLPWSEDGRPVLFSGVRRVIDRLRSRAPGSMPVQLIDKSVSTRGMMRRPAGLQRVVEGLFGNSRRADRSSNATGLEIVATAGQRAEVEWVALRIKQLLLQGVPPEDVVVAIRDLEEYRDLWLATARSAGLPMFVDSRPRLIDSPPVRDMLTWLAVEASDWEFDRLRGALRIPRTGDGSAVFPDDSARGTESRQKTVSALLHCLRRLQLPSGRNQIVRRLREGGETLEPQGGVPIPPSVTELVLQLDDWLANLRTQASLSGWSQRLQSLAVQVGTLRQPGTTPLDCADWDSALRLITGAAAIESASAGETRRLTLGEFVAEWTDLLRRERSGRHPPDWGRVRVLTPEAARTLQVRHLIVMGLGEQAFPRRRGEDCLGTAVERAGEGGALSPLTAGAIGSEERVAAEMLLFHRLLSVPQESLVLTYPAVSSGGGPLACSSFVEEVRDLFTPLPALHQQEDHLSPLPLPGRILGDTALRCHAVSRALAGEGGLFQAAAELPGLRSSLRGVLRAARLNIARFHTPGFTAAEGVLGDAGNRDTVARLYSPGRQYSATQLEGYANCPFRFGVANLLGVEPLDGLEYATDHGERGRLLHQLLARLHGGPLPDAIGEESEGSRVARRFLELLEAESAACQHAADPFLRIIGELEWAQLREWGVEYGVQWDDWRRKLGPDWDEPLEPRHFEAGFGASRTAPGGETEPRAEAQILRSPEGREVSLAGRIDRIDVGRHDDRPVYAVIDYKSGKKQPLRRSDIETGHNLQLPLYALAARRMGQIPSHAVAVQAVFWYLRDGGASPGLRAPGGGRPKTMPLLTEEDWGVIEALLADTVPRLVTRLQEAEFPVHNQDQRCQTYCAYHTICRVAQVRSVTDHLHKTWSLRIGPSSTGNAFPQSSPRSTRDRPRPE